MKDVIKVLGWFNPDITVEAIKKSPVVYSNEKLLKCFEVFNPSLTVGELKDIIEQIANMSLDKRIVGLPITTTDKRKGKFTEEIDNIIKKEYGKKKPREIAEIIKEKLRITIDPNKISQRAFYLKNKGK